MAKVARTQIITPRHADDSPAERVSVFPADSG